MKQGFIAISSVLIISAVVLVISITVSLLAIGVGQAGLTVFQGEKALGLVEGCMEDALLKVKQNSSYSGGTITRPEGNCIITVSKVGNTWTLISTNSDPHKRTIQTIINRLGSVISLSSWKEI